MDRLGRVVSLIVIAFFPVRSVLSQEAPAEVIQIEQAMQRAIKEVEPSVASVLISRSDVYRKLFHDQPSVDAPGKLGAFNPAVHSAELPNGDKKTNPTEMAQRYDLASPDYVPEASASGVIIDGNDLLVLTPFHAVRDATKIYVRLAAKKGSYADIYAADPRSDLALLRLLDQTLRPLKTVKFGDGGAVAKGQLVITVGNPFAPGFRDDSPGASWGIVSNIRRKAVGSPNEEDQRALWRLNTLLQTDARLNPATSGSALVNLKGEVIGLSTSRAAASGGEFAGGFAVCIDANSKRIIDRLRQGGEVEYGFLGVQCQQDPRGNGGLWIQRVISGSPADKAGLRVGECIVSVNGVLLREVDNLFLLVALLPAGSETDIQIRDRTESVKVILAKHYVVGKQIVSKPAPSVRGIRVDFTSVLWMRSDSGLQMPFQRREIPPGVFVSDLQPGSRAAAARLQLNDVITHVSGHKIDTPADFYRETAKVADTVPLELVLYSFDWNQGQASSKIVVP